MMYLHRPTLERLMADARSFIRTGSGTGSSSAISPIPPAINL
jgi:hypothetical protein